MWKTLGTWDLGTCCQCELCLWLSLVDPTSVYEPIGLNGIPGFKCLETFPSLHLLFSLSSFVTS